MHRMHKNTIWTCDDETWTDLLSKSFSRHRWHRSTFLLYFMIFSNRISISQEHPHCRRNTHCNSANLSAQSHCSAWSCSRTCSSWSHRRRTRGGGAAGWSWGCGCLGHLTRYQFTTLNAAIGTWMLLSTVGECGDADRIGHTANVLIDFVRCFVIAADALILGNFRLWFWCVKVHYVAMCWKGRDTYPETDVGFHSRTTENRANISFCNTPLV